MIKSKCLQLYQSLSKEQHFNFRKWLQQTSGQHHPDALQLFDILGKKTVLNKKTVAAERLFQQLYPEQELRMPRLRHVLSFATKSLELFIKQNYYLNDPLFGQKALLKHGKTHQLKNYAQQQLKQAQKTLQQQTQQNAAYYYQYYQLELEQFELNSAHQRPSSTNLQAIINGFSTFFVINLLRYACISLSHQNLYKANYKLPLLEPVLQAVSRGDYDEVPAVLLYYHSYYCHAQAEAADSFEALKAQLLAEDAVLDRAEYQEVYRLLINYCIRKQNEGKEKFIQEAFDWYRRGIEQQILLDENGQLSRYTYLNTITLGLKLRQFDWVEQFILDGAANLDAAYKAVYKSYNLGKFYFAIQDYEQAMPLLVQTNTEDLFMNIDIRVMQLKMYYEQESWETLEALLKSFTVFLQRKVVMSYHKTNYQNLIRLTRKLMEQTEKERLHQLITKTQPLTERAWLLEQL